MTITSPLKFVQTLDISLLTFPFLKTRRRRRNRRANRVDVAFILGARRTGTTLLNQILCNDPRANPHVGECQFLMPLCSAFRWGNINYDHVVQWYFDSHDDYLAFFVRLFADFTHTAADHFGGIDRLVLKSPEISNFKAELDQLLPQARFLVCIRDPRDQVASELDVGRRQLEQNIDQDSGRAFRNRDVDFLARKFLNFYQAILKGPQDRVRYVRYEDVILNTGETLRDLERFTGFNLSTYDPAAPWKSFEHEQELRKMPAFVEQYGGPLDNTRVGRYRQALTAGEQERVLKICADFMHRFYPESAG